VKHVLKRIFDWLALYRSRITNLSPAEGLAKRKDALAALQSLLTIAAIVLAGFWFLGNRTSNERVKTDLRISSRPYAGAPNENLVGVEVWVTNIGQTPIYLRRGRLKIVEVNPGNATLYECWYTIGTEIDACAARDVNIPMSFWDELRAMSFLGWISPPASNAWLEPGETAQVWMRKFRFYSDTVTVQVTSNIQTLRRSGWNNMTMLWDAGEKSAGRD